MGWGKYGQVTPLSGHTGPPAEWRRSGFLARRAFRRAGLAETWEVDLRRTRAIPLISGRCLRDQGFLRFVSERGTTERPLPVVRLTRGPTNDQAPPCAQTFEIRQCAPPFSLSTDLTSASAFGITRRNNTQRRLSHLPSHELAPSGHVNQRVPRARVAAFGSDPQIRGHTILLLLRCSLVAKAKAPAAFGLQHFSHG